MITASTLDQAIAAALMKTMHLAAETLQSCTDGHPKGDVLRDKKQLPILIGTTVSVSEKCTHSIGSLLNMIHLFRGVLWVDVFVGKRGPQITCCITYILVVMGVCD